MRFTVRYKWEPRMADETPKPKPSILATGTATGATGLTIKVLTPAFIAIGVWLSKHTGIVFPDGYGHDLMEWALVMIPAAVAYWHAKA